MQTNPFSRAERMRSRLSRDFSPHILEIIDESALHAGHAGAAPGGETHYRIVLVSAAFAGMSRIARSRAVHESLAEEFAMGLHALSLELRAR